MEKISIIFFYKYLLWISSISYSHLTVVSNLKSCFKCITWKNLFFMCACLMAATHLSMLVSHHFIFIFIVWISFTVCFWVCVRVCMGVYSCHVDSCRSNDIIKNAEVSSKYINIKSGQRFVKVNNIGKIKTINIHICIYICSSISTKNKKRRTSL